MIGRARHWRRNDRHRSAYNLRRSPDERRNFYPGYKSTRVNITLPIYVLSVFCFFFVTKLYTVCSDVTLTVFLGQNK